MRSLSVALLFFAAAACNRSEAPSPEAAAPAEPPKPGAVKGATVSPLTPLAKAKFGAAITETAATPLPDILKEPRRFSDKTVRTEGVVTAVCQSKGCWMQIADETGQAHIKFAGYSFFVPREASGHRAVVQGKLVPSEDHCASKDGCREEGEKAAGAVAKVDFEATGVEFVD